MGHIFMFDILSELVMTVAFSISMIICITVSQSPSGAEVVATISQKGLIIIYGWGVYPLKAPFQDLGF